MSSEGKTIPEAQAPVLLQDVIVRCAECGYEGPAEPQAPGKAWMEAVAWIAFVVPGLIYSFWRLFGRRYFCPRCKTRGHDVTVPTARKVAVALRAVLTVLLFVALGGLLMFWNVRVPG